MQTTQSTIPQILAATETIAVVGLSSRSTRAGYYVPAYLQAHGYRIIPVNPFLEEALGEQAYPDLYAVPGPLDLVLVFRLSRHIPAVVDAAIATGSRAIWTQLGIRHKAAAERARLAGLVVVMDACMLVEHRRWVGGG